MLACQGHGTKATNVRFSPRFSTVRGTNKLQAVMSNIKLHFKLAFVLGCAKIFIHYPQTFAVCSCSQPPDGGHDSGSEGAGRVAAAGSQQAGKNIAAVGRLGS